MSHAPRPNRQRKGHPIKVLILTPVIGIVSFIIVGVIANWDDALLLAAGFIVFYALYIRSLWRGVKRGVKQLSEELNEVISDGKPASDHSSPSGEHSSAIPGEVIKASGGSVAPQSADNGRNRRSRN